jgi:hypothetical protein
MRPPLLSRRIGELPALVETRRCRTIKFFNAEYRRRCEAASGFMASGRAMSPLRRAVAGVIAAGGTLSPLLVMQVFA